MDSSNVQVSDESESTASELPVYHCPLYVDAGQEAGDCGLADVNVITKIPLRTRINPVLCSLRAVNLVSLLWLNQPGFIIHDAAADVHMHWCGDPWEILYKLYIINYF